MGKTTVIYITFLPDVACQKLLKSAYVLRSYSKIILAQFLSHGVVQMQQNYCFTKNEIL